MKIADIFEGASGSGRPEEHARKRPKRVLWFDSKEFWGHDIKSRYPKAELKVDKEQDKYVAVDVESKMCYGVWNGSRNTGCTYDTPRPVSAAVLARRVKKLSKFEPAPQKQV